MNKLSKKIIFTFIFTLAILISGKSNTISIKAVGVGSSIEETFPDPVLAQLIATNLYKGVSDLIEQDDIDYLTTLSISDPNITNVSGIEYLVNLESLYLRECKILTVPSSLSSLVNLRTLNFTNNNITSVPDYIGSLNSLTELSFYANNILSFPDSLGNLTNLEFLYFSDNGLKEVPNFISNLSNLKTLVLNNNEITSIPESLTALTSLTNLSFNNNSIKSVPTSITLMPSLTSFSVNNQSIYEESIPWSDSINLAIDVTGFNFSTLEIDEILIKDNGTLSNNVITWNNIENKNQTLSYPFSDIYLPNYYSFSGTVFIDIIASDDILNATISPIEDVTYTGSTITPSLQIENNGDTLIEGTDYSSTYSDNINAGTATVTVNGNGKYSGSRNVTFQINKAVPTISSPPVASNISLNEALSASTLTGGSVVGLNNEVLNGTFTFKDPSLKITKSSAYEVVFTPENQNYESVVFNVNVSLNGTNELPKTGGNIIVSLIIILITSGLILIISRKTYKHQ